MFYLRRGKSTELNTNPFVSVIVPTFNRSGLVPETILSILNQTYTNFELIVVCDHSSGDKVPAIENMGDPRCRVYNLPLKSSGPASVRNYGIEKSSGSLIAFCDDDDLWHPSKLEKQILFLNNHPEISLLATNVSYFSGGGKTIKGFGELKNFFNNLRFIGANNLIAFYNCIVISSAIVRREMLAEVGNFNEEKDYHGHEDIDLWLRICLLGKAHIMPEKLTFYRIHQSQLSAGNSTAYKKESLEISKKYYSKFSVPQKIILGTRLLIYRITGQ